MQFKGVGRDIGHLEVPAIDLRHASSASDIHLVAIAEAMGVRGDDARVGLCRASDVLGGLKDIATILDDPHVEFTELEDVGLGGVELKRDQADSRAADLRSPDELKASAVADAAMGMDKAVARPLQAIVELGQISAAIQSRGEFTPGKAALHVLQDGHYSRASIQLGSDGVSA